MNTMSAMIARSQAGVLLLRFGVVFLRILIQILRTLLKYRSSEILVSQESFALNVLLVLDVDLAVSFAATTVSAIPQKLPNGGQ